MRETLTHNSPAYGFTLIELSIVLVIIGLIAGGIVVGNELVKVGQLRKTVSQIVAVETAINAFRGKYNALPGDMVTASRFMTGAVNGNGDSMIFTDYASGPAEPVNVWQHLSLAQMIPGNYPGYADVGDYLADLFPDGSTPATNITWAPQLPIRQVLNLEHSDWGSLGVTNAFFLNTLGAGVHPVLGQQDSCAVIPTDCYYTPGDSAYALDTKMDDGKPYSGRLREPSGVEGNPGYCTSGSPANWNIAETRQICGVVIKLGI